jgi:tagatose-1,6-bisphosphate aldolase non-catalytic subunit AgaZ/GatZ
MRAPIPVQLISQHFPLALPAVMAGSVEPDGPSLVTHAIRRVLGHYAAACRA